MKTYKQRATATQLLKQLGIKQDQYNAYIVTHADRSVTVDIERAKADVVKRVTKGRKSSEATVSSVARQLILSGLANAVVFAKLQAQFGLDDGKKGYPAWYRSELRRGGLLVEAAR